MNAVGRRRAGLLLLLLLSLLAYLGERSRRGELPAAELALRAALEVPLVSVGRLSQRAGDWSRDLFRRQRLSARIAELEGRLAQVELERAALEDSRRENVRLAALLDLKERTPGSVRGARVIAREATGSLRSLVIDAGSRDGVSKDAAVVSADGLVGRVLKVGERSSVVQLVADAASGIGVLDERSRVQGVLVGSGRDDCRLKYVPNLEDVRRGDRIVASGLDGIYPKGTVVGVVSEVAAGADAFQAVRVQPAAPLDRLETVLVFIRPEVAPAARLSDGLAEARPDRGGTLERPGRAR